MIARWMGINKEDRSGPLVARVRAQPFHHVVLLLCLINISLVFINFGIWITAAVQKLFFAADFTSFYTGYYLVRIGQGVNLYDPGIQSIYQQQFMSGSTFNGGVLLFPNPPYVAILFAPLSYVSLNAAFYFWSFIQLALLIWFLITINRLFSHWSVAERRVLILTILAFWPLLYTFLSGQFSLILLIGLTQMYSAIIERRFNRAGLWLLSLTIKPQSVLFPGVMTLTKRYWRIALVSFITSLAVFAFSILIFGTKPWFGYLQTLKAIGSYFGEYGVNPNSEYTLRGILSNIFGNSQGDLINTISITILFIGMIFTWLLWRQDIQQDSPRFRLIFSTSIYLSVFLSLHLNPHDSLMLILPTALFYDYMRESCFPRKTLVFTMLLSPMVFIFSAFNKFNFFGILRPPVVMILILLVWMFVYLIKDIKLKNLDTGAIVNVS